MARARGVAKRRRVNEFLGERMECEQNVTVLYRLTCECESKALQAFDPICIICCL